MSTVILKGEEALHYAESNGLTLNRYADESGEAREGIPIEEARELIERDPHLVWIEALIAINTGED